MRGTMKRIIDLSQERKNILFEATAREMKVSNTIVEKDFWVCVVLNYLLNESKYKDYFIFKGGTSLSKCYDVIKRFSEDADLVLKWDMIGFDDEEVYKKRSKTQDNKFELLMNERGANFIQKELKQDLIDNLANKIDHMEIQSDEKDPMVLYVRYPVSYTDAYSPPAVKLEIGPVAAKTPTEIKQIEPYCFRCFNADNKEPFNVETVSIARTFWEKLLILYAETNRPHDKKIPARYSRHYYDVYMIYKSIYFSAILKNKELFEEVKAFKSKYYRTSWSKIEESSLENLTIIPEEGRQKELYSDYENMKEMVFGDRPSFKEIINGLLELEGTLRCQ